MITIDINLVVMAGKLAGKPEVREFDSGTRLTRLLVTTSVTEPKRRIDVVPVVVWDDVGLPDDLEPGDRVWVAGRIQRRFWQEEHSGRISRIEVVAAHVTRHTDEESEAILNG